MNEDSQKPADAPGDATPEASEPPQAWQPLTPRGVAAFVRARWLRLFLMQLVVAAIVAASVVWFVAGCYSPVITQAIQKLPDAAGITNGQLAGIPTPQIAETKFLSIAVTDNDSAEIDQSADVQIALRKSHLDVSTLASSALGLVEMNYDTNLTIDLSRLHMQPLWGAWKPVFLAETGVGAIVWLLVVWPIIAIIYAPGAKFMAWFLDRDLSWPGAWRLASAALAPGALLLAVGIVLYGLQTVDLIGLSLLVIVHFVVGWVYLLAAPGFVPALPAESPNRNPFTA